MGAQTVPDMPSTATLPAHSASDLNFAIQTSTETSPTVTSMLTYQDWNGIDWSAQTYGGWFVQTCNSGANCPQPDSVIAGIRYVDWSGVNWTAERVGNKFVSVKNKPASTDKACPADPTTGVSAGSSFSTCSSYVSTSIPLQAPNGVKETVSLSMSELPAPPVFTSAITLPFTPRCTIHADDHGIRQSNSVHLLFLRRSHVGFLIEWRRLWGGLLATDIQRRSLCRVSPNLSTDSRCLEQRLGKPSLPNIYHRCKAASVNYLL